MILRQVLSHCKSPSTYCHFGWLLQVYDEEYNGEGHGGTCSVSTLHHSALLLLTQISTSAYACHFKLCIFIWSMRAVQYRNPNTNKHITYTTRCTLYAVLWAGFAWLLQCQASGAAYELGLCGDTKQASTESPDQGLKHAAGTLGLCLLQALQAVQQDLFCC